MATPFKRLCREAIRQSSRPSSQCPSQRCFVEHKSSRSISWRATTRSYATSRQPQSIQEDHDASLAFDIAPEDLIEDLPNPADLPSAAHAELQQHRELREMVRLAAWEMPLLSSLAKPFAAPDPKKTPLRWRYTTYFGDSHPNASKVVVSFNVDDLGLSSKQAEKLKKLCGSRYNPEKNIVRMSSESFETQAQNKRYLGDTIQTLLKEATDADADSFEDIPLDTRHYKIKTKHRFPEEWKLTAEKRKALEDKRRQILLEEGRKVEENTVVSGAAAIEAARQILLKQVEEPIMAEARQTLPKGKMGRKEMGQTRGANR